MSDYRLSKLAESDLLDIFCFGYQQFGGQQAEAYAAALEQTFLLLANNPEIGRRAETIAPGLRRHEHGSHVILYEETAAGVLVLAIVHNRSVQRLAF